MIGEAGPEAVVPLSSTAGASPLPSGGVGGSINIPITVNAGMDRESILRMVNTQLSDALRRAGVR
jgi:hypothetical protein